MSWQSAPLRIQFFRESGKLLRPDGIKARTRKIERHAPVLPCSLPRYTLALEFLEGDWEGRNSIPLSPFSTAARILKEPDSVI